MTDQSNEPDTKRMTMKNTLTLLTALLLAPHAVQILAAENLPTDHLVVPRGPGRDLQQSGLEKLWDYGDIAKEALDAEVVSSSREGFLMTHKSRELFYEL